MTSFRKQLLFVVIIFAVFIGFMIKLYFDWIQFLLTPMIPQGSRIVYQLAPNTGIKKLADDLHDLGYLNKPEYMI